MKTGALNECIDAHDDNANGYVVEYHNKVYGEEALSRQWASCGMQGVYKPFRADIAKAMTLTDWDIVNCHPSLLMQMCALHDIKCVLLTDYMSNRDEWTFLVVSRVNKALALAHAKTPPSADGKRTPPSRIGK